MNKIVECKPFHLRKRGDFGYCTTVDISIQKLTDDVKFYNEKLNDAISTGDEYSSEVFRNNKGQ